MASAPIYIVMALLSAVLMGTIGVFAKFTALPAEQITFYRLVFASLFLMAYMIMSGKGRQIWHKPSKRQFLNGAMLAGFMGFYIEAINYTSMANVIMVIYLAPLLSAVIAHFAFGEKLTIWNLAAIALALFGFTLMIPMDNAGIRLSSQELIGLGYALLTLLCYSGFMLINRKPSRSSPYQSTLVQLSVGALCLLPLIALQVANAELTLPNKQQMLWLLAIGFLPGFLAILFAVKALQYLPAVTFGTLAYLEPVAEVASAWWVFNETLSPVQLSGVGLIISAGIAQSWLSQRKTTPQTPVHAV